MKDSNQITVTSPLLPNLDDFNEMLKDIWRSKWITNNGSYHKALEDELCRYLKVPYISLFTNGTLPLITALQALRTTGEVITTPFSFVATTHSIWWNGIKPVFVDIDPSNCGLDPDKIEAAITPKTTAIMPVHCYGKPCDTERIQAIADKYGKTTAQVCMRWCLQHDTLPIVKTTHKERMISNVDIWDFELTAEEMAYIDTFPPISWSGQHPDFVNLSGKTARS